jgi:hypothetical protein
MLRQAFNVVLKYLKEYFPSLNTATGVIRDVFAKAFAILYYQEISAINSMLGNMDIRNYATMPEDALDRIGRMFLLERNQGGVATAVVRVYMPIATTVLVPAGWLFTTSSGLRFVTIRSVSISATQMAYAMVGDQYCFDVPVQAAAAGIQYNVEAGAISSSVSAFPFRVSYMTNLQPCSNGTDREDNAEFYERIVRSVNTRDLLITDMSISTVLLAAFPSLRSVEVEGAGDALMNRDIVYSIIATEGFNPYNRVDFWGKKRGVIRFNRSVGRKGSLDTTTIPEPSSDDLTALEECSQADYEDLYAYDLEYMQQRGGLIFGDTFDPPAGDNFSSILRVHDIEDWVASDSGYPFGTRKLGTSVCLFDGTLVLGATAADITTIPIA